MYTITTSAELVKQLYLEQKLSIASIANQLGISTTAVRHRLKALNVRSRPCSQKGRKSTKPSPRLSKLENTRFGHLVANHYVSSKGWLCQCDCGKQCYARTQHLTQGLKASCGCTKKQRGKLHYRWKGCGDISASLYQSYKHGAGRRNLEFSITIEQLWEILEKQNHKCAITGLPILIHKDKRLNSASPDRIDPTQGYTPDNIQWLHKNVNQMKWDLQQTEFIRLCKLVAVNN